jgi:hypothetical protein
MHCSSVSQSQGFICEEDAVTFDDLNAPCINHKEQCINCETVKEIMNADPVSFRRNPYYILFGEKIDKVEFRNLIERTCGIKVGPPPPPDAKVGELILPSKSHFEKNVKKIRRKLPQNKELNTFKKYLKLYESVIKESENWAKDIEKYPSEEILVRDMKQFILDEIIRLKIKNMGGCHYPRQILFGISVFVNALANTKSGEKFENAIKFVLDDSHAACFEATLQMATQKLV